MALRPGLVYANPLYLQRSGSLHTGLGQLYSLGFGFVLTGLSSSMLTCCVNLPDMSVPSVPPA